MSDLEDWGDEIDSERDLNHSRRFDVHKWSDHPEVNGFVNAIYEQLFKGGNEVIQKKHLKVLLLDLYVAWCDDPTLSIAISRNRNSYRAKTIYNEIHISNSTILVVDTLREAGLLNCRNGYLDRKRNQGRVSRIWPTGDLVSHFRNARFTQYDLHTHPDRLCIVLKDKNGNEIEFKPTKRTKLMQTFLVSYNTLIHQSFVSIPISESMRSEYIRSDGRVGFLATSQSNKFVKRVFNNSNFTQGGRFYGGWWQSCNKELRKHIFINDQPTNEIDYSALHPTLLYAKEGCDYWQEIGTDLYNIGDLELGFSTTESRDIVKKLFLILLNANNLKSGFGAFRMSCPNGSPEKRLTDKQLNAIVEKIGETHPVISKYLYTGVGLGLQFQDSQITELVLKHFQNKGVIALPIHDSYIVPMGYEEELAEAMYEAIRDVSGLSITPNIKQENCGYDDIFNILNSRYNPYQSDQEKKEDLDLYRIINPQRSERYLREMDEFNSWLETIQ